MKSRLELSLAEEARGVRIMRCGAKRWFKYQLSRGGTGEVEIDKDGSGAHLAGNHATRIITFREHLTQCRRCVGTQNRNRTCDISDTGPMEEENFFQPRA